MRVTGERCGLVVAALALLVAGCSGPDRTSGGGSPTPDPTAALRERCSSAVPADAELEALEVRGASGGELEAARVGPARSETVAVLLPQTSGLCGWGRWAAAAADAGVTSLLVNPCGYGESECTPAQDADPLNEVAAAVALARTDLGADRVVLLGTSMGGALTVMAVAAGAEVDAWADISGPASWEGVELAQLAGDLPATGIVVMATSDGPQPFADARTRARAARVPFVQRRYGHGWELVVDPVSGALTGLGRRLVALAAGPRQG